MKLIPKLSVPTIFLIVFLLIERVAEACYAARGLETSAGYELLTSCGLLWVIGWWLEDDGRRYGIRWIHDLGLFLGVAGIFIIPHHLFKTRGAKGFITILRFVGVYAAAYLISLMVYLALL
ncbi:MAG: hypothetical protein ACREBD_14105 [Blastocatellia bacterium]